MDHGWWSVAPPVAAIVLAVLTRRVLASQASGCNHIQHVSTQLPYAPVVAVVSFLCGTLPVGFGVPVWPVLPSDRWR